MSAPLGRNCPPETKFPVGVSPQISKRLFLADHHSKASCWKAIDCELEMCGIIFLGLQFAMRE
jgi:hypothetical protein